jgi:hypothetical protein
VNPLVVHVVRPYASEQEYLDAEAWSIEARSMLLLDTEQLPLDTSVLFDVALADGHKPIRAEGRVVGSVAPSGARPGGLKVRFKRFGSATKAFIERAVKAQERPSMIELEPPSATDLERPSMTELEAVPVPAEVAREPSGVRPRLRGPVDAPANREELLERLRRRRQAG